VSGAWNKKNRTRTREHAKAHRERIKADPERYAAHRARENAKRRENRKPLTEEQTQKRRSYHVESRYGITLKEYLARAEAQGGACAICGCIPDKAPGTRGGLYLDHNHTTGAPRALLCVRCNFLVGALETGPELWSNVMAYVLRHAEKV
jgi:hypothetical protein